MYVERRLVGIKDYAIVAMGAVTSTERALPGRKVNKHTRQIDDELKSEKRKDLATVKLLLLGKCKIIGNAISIGTLLSICGFDLLVKGISKLQVFCR